MKKGKETKMYILASGLEMASQLGLECVTIGALAKATNLSKSGLFAHFQSKENLQIEIMKYAADDFTEFVIIPAIKTKAGIPRIKTLINNWLEWSNRLTGGCIFVTAGTEYSDRPGKVRDLLLKQQEAWLDCMRRIAESAVRVGDFKENIDTNQFAFDLYSMQLGIHFYDKLLQDSELEKRRETALRELLAKYVSPPSI